MHVLANRRTPIIVASHQGKVLIVKMLLCAGSKIDATDCEGKDYNCIHNYDTHRQQIVCRLLANRLLKRGKFVVVFTSTIRAR